MTTDSIKTQRFDAARYLKDEGDMAQPRLDTVVRVLGAVGLGFKIVPLKKKRTGNRTHAQQATA